MQKNRSIKQIDGYKIFLNELLGKGTFAEVYKGVNDKTEQKVAVKILNKLKIDADEYLRNALFSEVKIMQCIKSQNVVGFYQVMQSSKNYYIVQQLCDGTLASIMKNGQIIPENKAKQYLQQIASGFLALVREGIIHRQNRYLCRDMKPANILMKGDRVKISDFGLSKKSNEFSKIVDQTIVGSPLYMSIQVLKSQPYSSKCDIWAVGFIYYQMLHGRPPWYGKSQFDLIKNIEKKPLEINKNLQPNTKDFLRKCLALYQKDRISWNQLFVHPIFNAYFQNMKGNTEFQNKLKMIMSDLRFQVNAKNIDLCRVLMRLGHKNARSELNKTNFYQFLKIVHPSISKQASDYIFNRVDLDQNGTVNITQIQQVLDRNSITFSTLNKTIPGLFKNSDNQQTFSLVPTNDTNKIKSCFQKLFKDITEKKYTLESIFEKFGKSQGNLNRVEFRKMLKNINSQLQNQEIDAAFNLIDANSTNSISFKQFDNYYNKVNGIPESPQQMQQQIKPNNYIIYEETPGMNRHHSNKQFTPPQNKLNPLDVIKNSVNAGQSNGYKTPPLHQQQKIFPPSLSPPQHYVPYQQGWQNQKPSMFDDFIMMQLQMNANQNQNSYNRKW